MRKVAWVISPPSKGSGGFRTICSKALYLDQHGFECHFFILPGAESYKSASQVAEEIVNWYGYEPKSVCVQALIPDCFDVAIATAWTTAEYVAMQPVSFKLYFIQDFEPWFYPVGESYLCAEHSYLLDLKPITIGRWLSTKVSNYYSHPVLYCDFGVDTAVYNHCANKREPRSVCAIFQPNKDRRLSGLLLEAIRLACSYDNSLSFYLFGHDDRLNIDERRVHQLGILSVSECAKLYSKCSVGISLSASNPSRLPFEMLASGLSVVELYGQNTDYDFSYDRMFFAEPSAEGIASALLSALEAPSVSSVTVNSIDNENQMFLDALLAYKNGDLNVPESPIKNKHYSDPIRPELYRLSNDKRILNYQIAAEAQHPIYSSHARLVMDLPDIVEKQQAYRAAYWLKSDQSDLQWRSFSVTNNCLTVDIDIPEIENESLLRIHLYAFRDMSDKPIFIGEITQLLCVQPCSEANLLVRKISFGNYGFQIEFNNNHSFCDEPAAFAVISSLKRLINH